MGDKVHVQIFHDQTVVEPGTMKTGAGKPMKVFTPYHRAWLSLIKSEPELLDTHPPPQANPKSFSKDLKSLFDTPAPKPSEDKLFASDEDKKRIRKMWPPGNAAAAKRMMSFLSQIKDYAETRSNPAKNSTSRLSAYFSAGMYSPREALSELRKYNKGSADFSEGSAEKGVYAWVRTFTSS
jgi:deoxyribodipyrimidine photo-lyase